MYDYADLNLNVMKIKFSKSEALEFNGYQIIPGDNAVEWSLKPLNQKKVRFLINHFKINPTLENLHRILDVINYMRLVSPPITPFINLA